MSYVPNNVYIYMAAFSGALAGMSVQGRQPVDTDAANYAGRTLVAGAWAQALDTVWGATADALDVEEAESLSIAFWSERQPAISVPYTLASNWLPEASTIAAIISQSEVYFASQGIVPAPLPSEDGEAVQIISAGTINNLPNSGESLLTLSGALGSVLLTGIVAPHGGAPFLDVVFDFNQQVTIANNSGLSAVGNRFSTPTGADLIFPPAGTFTAVRLRYSPSLNAWIVLG